MSRGSQRRAGSPSYEIVTSGTLILRDRGTPHSREYEPALGIRDVASETPRGFNPLSNHDFKILERFTMSGSIRRTAGQFRSLGHERLIGFAPIDDDFIFNHRDLLQVYI